MKHTKSIAIVLLLISFLTISGTPLLVHHCCGEIESISFSLQHEDECCMEPTSQISIDIPACCGDELIDTAMNLEGIPQTISIVLFSPLIKLLHSQELSIQLPRKRAFHVGSYCYFPSSSSLFFEPEGICIFRI